MSGLQGDPSEVHLIFNLEFFYLSTACSCQCSSTVPRRQCSRSRQSSHLENSNLLLFLDGRRPGDGPAVAEGEPRAFRPDQCLGSVGVFNLEKTAVTGGRCAEGINAGPKKLSVRSPRDHEQSNVPVDSTQLKDAVLLLLQGCGL